MGSRIELILVGLGLWAALVLLLPLAIIWFEKHPHPLREWRARRGPQERCPRCGRAVPLGLIEARRQHHLKYWATGLLGVPFEDQLDSSFLSGDGECAVCGTRYDSRYVPAPRAETWARRYGT